MPFSRRTARFPFTANEAVEEPVPHVNFFSARNLYQAFTKEGERPSVVDAVTAKAGLAVVVADANQLSLHSAQTSFNDGDDGAPGMALPAFGGFRGPIPAGGRNEAACDESLDAGSMFTNDGDNDDDSRGVSRVVPSALLHSAAPNVSSSSASSNVPDVKLFRVLSPSQQQHHHFRRHHNNGTRQRVRRATSDRVSGGGTSSSSSSNTTNNATHGAASDAFSSLHSTVAAPSGAANCANEASHLANSFTAADSAVQTSCVLEDGAFLGGVVTVQVPPLEVGFGAPR